MSGPVFHYRMTDYDSRLIPNRLIAELDDGATTSEEWIAQTGLSIGYPGWGLLYYVLLTVLDPDRPNFVVETGTNLGSSTIIIAQAIADSGRDAAFHTIEIDVATHEEAVRRLDRAGVRDLITAHRGDSLAVLPDVLDLTDEVSVAFLDGNHDHDHVLREFDLVEPKLRHDGVIVMDNTYRLTTSGPDPRVNGALRTIQHRYGGNIVNLPFCSWYTPGIAIWQRRPFEDMTPPDSSALLLS